MSTRIIIKNLPHNITNTRLKQHFSSSQSGNDFFSADVTDAKLVTDAKTGKSRGFAFVGYRTAQDAEKAVEWFNGTFVDMRKISVEIAKRAGDESLGQSWREKNREYHERQKRKSEEKEKPENKKRKLSGVEADEDGKATVIKELTGSKGKNRLLAQNPDLEKAEDLSLKEPLKPVEKPEKKDTSKRRKASVSQTEEPKKRVEVVEQPTVVEVVYDDSAHQPEDDDQPTEEAETTTPAAPPQSDLDWLRSRTSRTLGLVSDDEESDIEDKPSRIEQSDSEPESEEEGQVTPVTPPATEPSDTEQSAQPQLSLAESKILKTGRLFARNLVYGIIEDDLRAVFSPYGAIEEVNISFPWL